jgi:membrane protease YdiL (CAAX protease family)
LPAAEDARSTAGQLPGGGIFTLERRQAPGLYVVAWLLSAGGAALTFIIGPMATADRDRLALLGAGAIILTLGLAIAAGYQVVERRGRDLDRYRGPAPPLVFGVYFMGMSLVGLLLITGFGMDPDQPISFFAIGLVQAVGYALVVWLFAVRSGALSWPQMGWPTWRGTSLQVSLASVGYAVMVMLPVTLGVLILGGIIGLIVGVDAPQVLPLSTDATDGFFVTITAALIIPVGEELFFRGFALTAWLRDLGARSALIRSSVFFALVHVANITTSDFGEGVGQVVLTTAVLLPVGLVLGWLFIRRGMAAAIGGHVTYNSLLLALALLASRIPEPV